MPRDPITGGVTSTCPACGVGCRLAYDPDVGRATGREGPANPNGRLCAAGIDAYDTLRDGRLTTPLVREDGDLRDATWPEALDRAAAGIRDAVRAGGPDATAFLGAPRCTVEENYLLAKVARLLGTNNVDNRARLCHAATERALETRLGCGATTTGLRDLDAADAFLVVGADPARSHPVAFNTHVRPRVNRGATLVVLDPRDTETARLADHHLPARPGTDAAVLRAIAAATYTRGHHDRAFVGDRTRGFDAHATFLEGVDVDRAAAHADLDPGDLRAAADAVGAAHRAAALTGTGIEPPDHRDTAAPDALLDLLLLTGNLGRRGTGLVVLRGLTNEQGAVDAGARPDALPGGEPVTDAAARRRLEARWDASLPDTPGRTETELVSAFGDDVHAAWVVGENPAENRLDAFTPPATLVVQDVTHTETTAHADVVLPASAWAEKAGTVTNLDRAVQALAPAADPPGDARRDLDVIAALGGRLLDRDLPHDPDAVFCEFAAATPTYRDMTPTAVRDGGARWPADTSVLHSDRFANGDRRVAFSSGSP